MSQHIKDIDKDFDGFSRFLAYHIMCVCRRGYGIVCEVVKRGYFPHSLYTRCLLIYFRERKLLENVACLVFSKFVNCFCFIELSRVEVCGCRESKSHGLLLTFPPNILLNNCKGDDLFVHSRFVDYIYSKICKLFEMCLKINEIYGPANEILWFCFYVFRLEIGG